MIYTFSEVLEIHNGKNQRNVENKNGNYPIYGSGGIIGFADKYLCDEPAVIIGRKGSINNPIFVDKPFWNVDTAFALVPNSSLLDVRYLYYFCLSYNFNVLSTTVTIPSLTKFNLLKVKIEVPSLEEQKQIVHKLDKIEMIIGLKERQLKDLEGFIRSRFIEMFGHSDRPKVRLGECCIINPKKSSDIRLVDNDLMVSFVSMSDVSEDGQIVTCNHKQYESVKSGFTYFSENDVLFAKITPCMENGKGGIAKGLLNGIGFGSTEFHVLRPIDQVSNSCWLYELTSFPQFRQAAEINMTGSAGQRRVPASFLANYKVSLPPISLQNQFADFVHQLDKSKYREAIFLYLLEDIRICCNI
ncbi:MAG: restriction endonuclease subunit S [Dialister sp.]|uniref:restriction endonuclease subunit S n=1 Tax=Dialister sp. TaxID=1955814 RepID=UPI002E78EDAC|nr:restriction endonuclease subunit S [Dialister sp.]MEE0291009.1 restriction endonuclease subunit S [Dialister sp.]